MKKMSKRLMALVLAGVMAVGTLTGCGGKGGSSQKTSVEFDKNLIFKANYYKKPEEFGYMSSVQAGADGKVYTSGFSTKAETNIIVAINPDNGEVEKRITPKYEADSWMMNFCVDKEGNLWQMVQTYVQDEQNLENSKSMYYLIEMDGDGKELKKQQLEFSNENFYPSLMVMDDKGNVLCGGYDGYVAFDASGKEILNKEGSYVDSMIKAEDGSIYLTNYNEDYTGREFTRVDLEAKKTELVRTVNDTTGTLISGKDGIYLNDGVYLYQYNIETEEKTKMINWINSDIDGTSTYGIIGMPDGRFTGQVYDDLSGENQIVVMEKVQPEDVKEKKLVSLATPYSDSTLSTAVIAFNKQSEEYRVVVDDYSVYATTENYSAGAEKLNTDLVAGKVPDLLSVSSMSLGSYISKGLFVDLYEKMDSDSEFNRSDYLENIFKANETDGKLYSIIPSFTVMTVVGKEANVGKTPGWTLEDLEKAMEKMPEGAKIFNSATQQYILQQGLFLDINQYIDYGKGTCNFDTEDFKKLLAFAKQFTEDTSDGNTAVYETDAAVDESGLANDKILLSTMYLYNYNQIHEQKYYDFGGADLTLIGFPTASKKGAGIVANMELALYSKATYPDGAWAFIKYVLGEEYQSSKKYEWPVRKSAFAKLKEAAQKPDTYLDENGKEQVVEETVTLNGKEVKIGKVTDEEVAKVDELLNSVSQVMRYDTKVEEIITEESGAYFADQKSADEVARLIQNRVQTYLSESQ